MVGLPRSKGTTAWAVCLVSMATCMAAYDRQDEPITTDRSMAQPAQTKSAGTNRPPQIEDVTLVPEAPRPGSSVQARVQSRDPDGDAVELRYLWTLDGRRVAERGARLSLPETMRKGTPVEVEVVAHDGNASSEPVTAAARIGNRPPGLVAVALEPTTGVRVDEEVIAIAQARDADGDALEFSYDWRVNGEAVEGDTERLSTAGLARGDRIEVRVRVSDGEDDSAPRDSDPLVIGNSAPRILSTPGGVSADGQFRYTVEAKDPDGDRLLRYRLLSGPEGARVDPVGGEVLWTASRDHVGTHRFEVEVADGHGGTSQQRFEVAVREVENGGRGGPTGDEERAGPASLE